MTPGCSLKITKLTDDHLHLLRQGQQAILVKVTAARYFPWIVVTSSNARFSSNLTLPFPRVEVIRMNFRYQFVSGWNSVSAHFKILPSLKTLKKPS